MTAGVFKREGSCGPLSTSERVKILLTGAVGVLAAVLAVSAAGALPSPRLHGVNVYVYSLAIDGTLVAYAGSSANCDRALVWDLQTGRDRVVSGKASCDAGRLPFDQGVVDVAIAGSRAAWIVQESGRDEAYDTLYAGPVSGAGEQKLAEAPRFGTPTGTPDGSKSSGTWLWRLKGAGGLIVAELVETSGGKVTSDLLRRVTAKGLAPLVGSSSRIADFDVDAGRVAVLRNDVATVYSQTGSPVRSFPTPKAYALALAGSQLVLARPGMLDVYDLSSGQRVHSWPVQPGPDRGHRTPELDATPGVAAFDDYDEGVFAVNLETGMQRRLAKPASIGGLAIGSGGLVYLFGLDHNRLGFFPRAAVKAAVS